MLVAVASQSAEADLRVGINAHPVGYGCDGVLLPLRVQVPHICQPPLCGVELLGQKGKLMHILPEAHMSNTASCTDSYAVPQTSHNQAFS